MLTVTTIKPTRELGLHVRDTSRIACTSAGGKNLLYWRVLMLITDGHFTGIKRNDAGTWGDDHWPPKFFDSGIINKLEVRHKSQLAEPHLVHGMPACYDGNCM
jgi:hypothetical protein